MFYLTTICQRGICMYIYASHLVKKLAVGILDDIGTSWSICQVNALYLPTRLYYINKFVFIYAAAVGVTCRL